MSQSSRPTSPTLQPLDRWTAALALGLGLAIGAVLWGGDRGAARVREFNWQGKQVGAGDRALIFTFSRPMDRRSVEENFKIDPPLAGKFSWAGRRMAYTLAEPVPYGGTVFQVTINGAKDRFAQTDAPTSQPFAGQFQSRDRALVYLGVTGEEASRLVLYNLTRQERQVLTPPELVVLDFKPYPEGDRLLFSATDRRQFEAGQFDPKLYTITTGINYAAVDPLGQNPVSTDPNPQAGLLRQILNSDNYQNLKFDLAPNGETIVVQRANKANPGVDFGLWVIQGDEEAQPLDTAPGGEFLIAPDSQSVVMAQGQGLAVLPLESGAEPLDFLPQFGQVLDLAADGTRAAMVRFNNDYTKSLFLVTNQGTQRELWRTDGSIVSTIFDPTQSILYSLVTRLVPGDTYQEAPFIIAINLQEALAAPETEAPSNAGVKALARLATQRDITMSVSPDGLALLFDQIGPSDQDNALEPRGSDGKPVGDSQLWLLPLVVAAEPGIEVELPQPEPLPIPGIRPQWLP
ncbi:hypothetical protein [Prochlorothrix hollandica]|uniref:hypothetical protein n=1 Tax=Prochlorothrix hollandica TaxID=1223 RepID=UPI003342BCA4